MKNFNPVHRNIQISNIIKFLILYNLGDMKTQLIPDWLLTHKC